MKELNILAHCNIGFTYGMSTVSGKSVQGIVTIASYHAGIEHAKTFSNTPDWDKKSINEKIEHLLKVIDLADEVEVNIETKFSA